MTTYTEAKAELEALEKRIERLEKAVELKVEEDMESVVVFVAAGPSGKTCRFTSIKHVEENEDTSKEMYILHGTTVNGDGWPSREYDGLMSWNTVEIYIQVIEVDA